MIIAPKRLRSGSKVAIVAPSGPVVSDEVQVGLDIIKECGLTPILGPCVKNLKTTMSHAASVKERVDELNWAFSNPNISAVISVQGGEGSSALLPYLDYKMIRASRKAFVGMSDLSAISAGLLVKAGLISICGQTPSVRLDEGDKVYQSDCESFKLILELMKSDQPWGSRPFNFNPYFPRTVSSGIAEGIAVGGNLDTFVHLVGTSYMPPPDGKILFVEDVHKGGVTISRELLHLRLSGYLKRISGAVIGEFEDEPKHTEPKTPAIEDVVIEYFSNGPPCSYGYSFSHGPLTSPIPIGARCRMDADTGEVSFDFSMST